MAPHDSPDPAPDLSEHPVIVDCAGERLIGVICQPAGPADTGVLIMVGGRQYRAGSHRQFVLLARRLASADFSSLRFDFRGMGDSTGEPRSFEAVDDDIAAALAAFKTQCPHLKRVVLWGLCDAATAAVLYWQRTNDPFVAGLCLVNPWLRTETSLARARVRYYYVERLLDPAFWLKLLRGGVTLSASLSDYFRQRRLARRVTSADFIAQTIDGLRGFPGALLVILSGQDLVAKEFVDTINQHAGDIFLKPFLKKADILDADHTFSNLRTRLTAEKTMLSWLHSCFQVTRPRKQADIDASNKA